MSAKGVLLALAEHVNAQGWCFPSHQRLAELTHQSRRTVITRLVELEAAGLIRSEHRTRPNGGKSSNGYLLLMQGTLSLAPDPEPEDYDVQETDVQDLHIDENGGKPPNDPEGPMCKSRTSHVQHVAHRDVQTVAHPVNLSALNQESEKSGAGARDEFVRDEDPLWKPLEAMWLREHPDKRSMPRSNENGWQGWRFPIAQINNVRDRGGKVLA